jgi:hypothetical protein
MVDVLLDAAYLETADLLLGWSAIRRVFKSVSDAPYLGAYDIVVPAIPPFYWGRHAHTYRTVNNLVTRPPDALFYANEQDYYLEFARALECDTSHPPHYFLPCGSHDNHGVWHNTLVLAPGCKTGEMASKRWPYFVELADRFKDVVLVGTIDDMFRADGTRM